MAIIDFDHADPVLDPTDSESTLIKPFEGYLSKSKPAEHGDYFCGTVQFSSRALKG